MFMTKTGTRQDHGGKARVADMDGKAGGYERGLARFEGRGRIQTGAQIQSRRACGGVFGQGNGGADAWVEDFKLDVVHDDYG